MATMQDDRIGQLARQLQGAVAIEDLRTVLRDIAAFEEMTPEEVRIEDLRDETFRGLRRMTSGLFAETREILVEDLLPFCLMPKTIGQGIRWRMHYGEFLRNWLDDHPGEERRQLRYAVLPPIVAALDVADPLPAIITASYLAFRDDSLSSALHDLVARRDDEVGDRALRALIMLGVPKPAFRKTLDILHRRITVRWNNTLVECMKAVPDLSSLDLVFQWLQSRPQSSGEDHAENTLEDLTVQIIPRIVDRYPDNTSLQDTTWRRIADLIDGKGGPIDRALRMNSQLACGLDTPDVIPAYLELIDRRAAKTNDIIYYRLEELIRPRHCLGWDHLPADQVLEVLRRDACVSSSMQGRWETGEYRLRLMAWDTLFSLGLSDLTELLGPVLESEGNGFALGELLEMAACTEVSVLPPDLPRLIAGKSNRVPDVENQRLIAQIGAIKVAHSARSREAFDALLDYETIGSPGVLLSLIDALADCAAARIAEGDTDAEPRLWQGVGRGESATRRTASAAALAKLIRRHVVRPRGTDELLAAIEDETLDIFARNELIDATGHLDAIPPDSRIALALIRIARSNRRDGSDSKDRAWPNVNQIALGALARLGVLANDPPLLEELIGLARLGQDWAFTTMTDRSSQLSFVVGLLYVSSPGQFAPAVASIIDAGDWGAMSRLRPHLERGPVPPPSVVVDALIQRILRVNTSRQAEPELFALMARLDADRMARERWPGWDECPPPVRAAFADAIRIACPSEDQALDLLVPLMNAGQYGVRRAAYRAASAHASTLANLCWLWATTGDRFSVESRERAAEAAAWLPSTVKITEIEALADDHEPTVRNAYARCDLERRERAWAALYVDEVVKVRIAAEIPSVWRYGLALGKVADDSTLERLERRRGEPDLPPAVQRWLSRIIKKVRKRWDETTRRWPEPWYARGGRIEAVVGTIAGEDGQEEPFKGWLWQEISGESISLASWGGWTTDVPHMADDLILKIEGRLATRIMTSNSHLSNIFGSEIVHFFGREKYPERL